MKFWVLLVVLSCENLVKAEDNIAMESEVNYHRTRYTPDSERQEENYYRGNDREDYGYNKKQQSDHQRKHVRTRQERENVFLNNNHLVNRAREPRDEVPWQPSSNFGHYGILREGNNKVGDQKETRGSKTFKYEEELAKQQHFNSRFPSYSVNSQPSEGKANYYQGYQKESDKHPQQQFSDITTPHLQNIDESMNDGKFLGFTSFVEHFPEGEDNEEMLAAMKEGTLDDIKKIVPKSGMTFKIYHQGEGGETAHIVEQPEKPIHQSKPKEKYPFFKPNDIRSTEVSPTSSPAKWNKNRLTLDDYYDKSLPNRTPLPLEHRSRFRKTSENKLIDARPIPTPDHERDGTLLFRLQEEESRNVLHKLRPRPQPTQSSEKNNEKNEMTTEETRVYPQIVSPTEASFGEDSHKFQNERSRFKEENHNKANEFFESFPTRSSIQNEKLTISSNQNSHLYEDQGSTWKPLDHNGQKLEVASESEVQKPGSYVETLIVHSSPKLEENSNYHHNHNHLKSHELDVLRPKKPEKFDHSKAIQESTSFDIANAVEAHLKQEQGHIESSRAPIQFGPAPTSSQKEREKPLNMPGVPKHLRKLVQKYADSLIKNFGNKEEPIRQEADHFKSHSIRIPDTDHRSHSHIATSHSEFIPRPAALVSNNRPHKFEMETPIMTEEEFDHRFGNFPTMSPNKVSHRPLNSFSHDFNELKFSQNSKSPSEMISHYWTKPEQPKFIQGSHPSPGSHDEYNSKVKLLAEKVRNLLNHQTVKSESLTELLSEASQLEQKHVKDFHFGQIERPIPNWKDGKIHMTKELKNKLAEIFIKTPGFNLEESKHPRPSVEWTGTNRLKKSPTKIKSIILNPSMSGQSSNLKFDIKLTPSIMKREDDTDGSQTNIFIGKPKQNRNDISLEPSVTPNLESKENQKQNVVILGPENKPHKQFSVGASYQIDRSSKNIEIGR